MTTMADFGDFAPLAPLLVTHERLRMQMLDRDLIWVLPPDVLAGVSEAYGIPVVRADVPRPLLAHDSTFGAAVYTEEPQQ